MYSCICTIILSNSRCICEIIILCIKLNMNKFPGSFSYFTACFEKPGHVMWNHFLCVHCRYVSNSASSRYHSCSFPENDQQTSRVFAGIGRRSLCHCGLSSMLWIIFGSIFVLVLRYFPNIWILLSCENTCLMQKVGDHQLKLGSQYWGYKNHNKYRKGSQHTHK